MDLNSFFYSENQCSLGDSLTLEVTYYFRIPRSVGELAARKVKEPATKYMQYFNSQVFQRPEREKSFANHSRTPK